MCKAFAPKLRGLAVDRTNDRWRLASTCRLAEESYSAIQSVFPRGNATGVRHATAPGRPAVVKATHAADTPVRSAMVDHHDIVGQECEHLSHFLPRKTGIIRGRLRQQRTRASDQRAEFSPTAFDDPQVQP